MTHDERFNQLLEEEKVLRAKKNSDYAHSEDTMSNLRECEDMGIPAWVGVIVRMTDKMSRLKRLARKNGKGSVDETIIDTLKDISIYAKLCIILFEENGKI